jgi:DNA-binding SARP family transcriptional activator
MRIAVLGPLEVRSDDGVPLTVPGAKERLLLALLTAAAPAAVGIDALAESLWDGDPPATAHKSLQVHVVRLRSSLEPDRPRGSTGRYIARRAAGLRPDRSSGRRRRAADRRPGGPGSGPALVRPRRGGGT